MAESAPHLCMTKYEVLENMLAKPPDQDKKSLVELFLKGHKMKHAIRFMFEQVRSVKMSQIPGIFEET